MDLEQQAEIRHLINLSQNRALSDTESTDRILTLQGVGWVTRKIVNTATITLYIKHYKDEEGVEHIDTKRIITGGITASPEKKTLDWTWRNGDNNLFGSTIGRARRIPVADITDEYLKSGWLPEVSRDGAIEVYGETDKEKNSLSWKSDVVSGSSRYESWTSHVLT